MPSQSQPAKEHELFSHRSKTPTELVFWLEPLSPDEECPFPQELFRDRLQNRPELSLVIENCELNKCCECLQYNLKCDRLHHRLRPDGTRVHLQVALGCDISICSSCDHIKTVRRTYQFDHKSFGGKAVGDWLKSNDEDRLDRDKSSSEITVPMAGSNYKLNILLIQSKNLIVPKMIELAEQVLQQNRSPRILVMGDTSSGKEAMAKTIMNSALGLQRSPVLVDIDPDVGLLAAPGTLGLARVTNSFELSNNMNVFAQEYPKKIFYGHHNPATDHILYDRALASVVEVLKKEEHRSTSDGGGFDGFVVNTHRWTKDHGYKSLLLLMTKLNIDHIFVHDDADLHAKLFDDLFDVAFEDYQVAKDNDAQNQNTLEVDKLKTMVMMTTKKGYTFSPKLNFENVIFVPKSIAGALINKEMCNLDPLERILCIMATDNLRQITCEDLFEVVAENINTRHHKSLVKIKFNTNTGASFVTLSRYPKTLNKLSALEDRVVSLMMTPLDTVLGLNPIKDTPMDMHKLLLVKEQFLVKKATLDADNSLSLTICLPSHLASIEPLKQAFVILHKEY